MVCASLPHLWLFQLRDTLRPPRCPDLTYTPRTGAFEEVDKTFKTGSIRPECPSQPSKLPGNCCPWRLGNRTPLILPHFRTGGKEERRICPRCRGIENPRGRRSLTPQEHRFPVSRVSQGLALTEKPKGALTRLTLEGEQSLNASS